ncbi:hypothetical protein [Methylobacterium sp. CCH5-D2]|uniref:hypothetical protein n=1 Tax=Methylobacterium sp. CCH5-D2 TaxID=1768765 RepID=UPI0008302A76|nr:hypothetical protein [Methylobacterium sp. CCH5-D2]
MNRAAVRFPLGWRVAVLYVAVASAVLLAAIGAGHAQDARVVTGFQILAEACRPAGCVALPPSPRTWGQRYACQTRAEAMQQFAEPAMLARIGLPAGAWTVRARCVPVYGLRSA